MLQQYLGRFYLGDTATAFSVGGHAVVLPTGKYYLCGYTSEGVNQLCETMQAAIRSADGSFSSATVTYSGTTGLVTIALGVTGTISWTDVGLQQILGFAGTQSGSATYVGTLQPRYVWRPSEPPSDYSVGDLSRWWSLRSRTLVHVSGEGSISTTVRSPLYQGFVEYTLLPQAEVVIIDGTSGWEPFEQFWLDVINGGEPVRCYPDRTLAAVGNVFTCEACSDDESAPVGDLVDFRSRHVREWDGLWGVQFSYKKYLEAT